MAEVIIELDLKRRSGVLAGAVAALRNLSLDFKSQQRIDHEGTPRLILRTEGRIAGLAEVVDAYAQARGVSGLADVRVDGVSLMNLAPEPDPVTELQEQVPAQSVTPPDTAAAQPRALSEPEPSADDDAQAAKAFSDAAFAAHVLVQPVRAPDKAIDKAIEGTQPSEPSKPQSSQSNADSVDERADESDVEFVDDNGNESTSGLKPSMVRRRRRRR